MDTYSILRELADSWALLAMTALFLGLCLWVFRPAARKAHDDAANLIFRNDRRPADQTTQSPNRNKV